MYDSNTGQWQAIEESASIPAVTSANTVVCEVTERPSRWWIANNTTLGEQRDKSSGMSKLG
jgi:hypothetical protein